ncbi:MAG: tRNA (adenosine(37)-N6)-threonylcarbamoyltransferase complex dimerization subunit type 1 TsaB [Calditerrivibrio sp.]|nr:tRNA (adenosine(37)-N6)-threonylcarbamoyltransferase complex dimerization subunit type 1 TsaB [Calditerrivibrio sp.]
MIRFILDTSCRWFSVSISKGKELLFHSSVLSNNKVSEMLFNIIDKAFCTSNIDKKDVDEFYVVTGPGSFTGLRIGVSSCYGMATALKKPVYGLTTNDAYAIGTGIEEVETAVKLRGKEYVYKKYNFSRKEFSDFLEIERGNLPQGTKIIEKVDTDRCIVSDLLEEFRTTAEPFYFKKSEAEIQFDKKSCRI